MKKLILGIAIIAINLTANASTVQFTPPSEVNFAGNSCTGQQCYVGVTDTFFNNVQSIGSETQNIYVSPPNLPYGIVTLPSSINATAFNSWLENQFNGQLLLNPANLNIGFTMDIQVWTNENTVVKPLAEYYTCSNIAVELTQNSQNQLIYYIVSNQPTGSFASSIDPDTYATASCTPNTSGVPSTTIYIQGAAANGFTGQFKISGEPPVSNS
jgi:hypothetical protein